MSTEVSPRACAFSLCSSPLAHTRTGTQVSVHYAGSGQSNVFSVLANKDIEVAVSSLFLLENCIKNRWTLLNFQ